MIFSGFQVTIRDFEKVIFKDPSKIKQIYAKVAPEHNLKYYVLRWFRKNTNIIIYLIFIFSVKNTKFQVIFIIWLKKHTVPCRFPNRETRGIAHRDSFLTHFVSCWRTGPKLDPRILIPFPFEQISWNSADRQVGQPKIVAVRHSSTFAVRVTDSRIQNSVIMKAFKNKTQTTLKYLKFVIKTCFYFYFVLFYYIYFVVSNFYFFKYFLCQTTLIK